jgi:hypothetical protein
MKFVGNIVKKILSTDPHFFFSYLLHGQIGQNTSIESYLSPLSFESFLMDSRINLLASIKFNPL